ncbi:MAG: glycosyltransferase family 4 protein, partial [Candidatus Promineifilaceae bacterium]
LQDGQNGLLVEPGNAAQLGQALIRLAGDRPLARRLGAAARQTVEARYAAADVTGHYARLLALPAQPAAGHPK